MAIKTYKPTTPGHRQMSVTDYSVLSKVEPEKSLLTSLKKNSGRNSYGRITVRHRGGGNRRKPMSSPLNTIRTVPLTLHSCSMRTARNATLSLRTD